jgi:hypothetical protein
MRDRGDHRDLLDPAAGEREGAWRSATRPEALPRLGNAERLV